jgi:hypothetical protein
MVMQPLPQVWAQSPIVSEKIVTKMYGEVQRIRQQPLRLQFMRAMLLPWPMLL